MTQITGVFVRLMAGTAPKKGNRKTQTKKPTHTRVRATPKKEKWSTKKKNPWDTPNENLSSRNKTETTRVARGEGPKKTGAKG